MISSQQGPRQFEIAKWAIAALLAVIWQAGAAFSAGLGELKVVSRMGQPFAGEIELINVSRAEIATLQVALAPPSAYEAANLRFDPVLNTLKLSVERRANGTPYVRATSTRRVNEPYMELLVDLVSQDGKFRRGYAALLDPPEFADPAAATAQNKSPPTAPVVALAPIVPIAPAARTQVASPETPPSTPVRRPAVAQRAATGGAPAAVPAPVPSSPAPATAAPVQRTPVAPAAAITGAAVQPDARPAEPVKPEAPKLTPAETAPAVTPSPRPEATQPPAVQVAEVATLTPQKANPPAPQPDFLDMAKAYAVPAGGIILALLAGLAGLWAWRRNKAQGDPFVAPGIPRTDTPATRNSLRPTAAKVASVLPAGAIAAGKPKAPPSPIAPAEPTVSSVTDMVDPVEEATVYLKHSQDETAENILRETLSKQPGREDALMLLLEILAQRGDTEGFNQLAGRLHKQTGGLGTNWKRAMAMGFALDPGYPLYSPPGSAPVPTTRAATDEAVPGHAATAADDMGNTIDINLSNAQAALDMDKTMVLPYAVTKPAAPAVVPLPDINFEFPAASKPVAAASPQVPATPAAKDVTPLDFKIDLPAFENKPKSEPAAPAPATTPAVRDEHWESVQQKLDLARAYREMGDKDGAMELLEEVGREGDAAQQADARQIRESFA